MSSRPLPPGRRGRGGRAAPTLHLPEPKILADVSAAPAGAAPTSSYVEQLHAERLTVVSKPEHDTTTSREPIEPAPVQSVKAFVSSLEKAQDAPATARASVAAAAGEDAMPRAIIPETVDAPTPAFSTPVQPPVHKFEPEVVAVSAPPPTPQAEDSSIQQAYTRPTQPVYKATDAPAPQPAAAAVAPATERTPVAAHTVSVVGMPVLEGFHPFKAVLPIYSVPEVPESVECVYDDEAVEMQKNILKVVKKLAGRDRSKLEDFKINSRLFGNNFMDPLEYVESLTKDLGGNKALVLLPCLVSIQPDFMKRSSMLVAARNYRLRNLSKLETSLDKVQAEDPVVEPAPVTKSSPNIEVVTAVTAAEKNSVSNEVFNKPTEDKVNPSAMGSNVAVPVTSSSQSTVNEAQTSLNNEAAIAEQTPVMPSTTSDRQPSRAAEPADAPVEQPSEDVTYSQVSMQPELSEPLAHSVAEAVAVAVSEQQHVEATFVESVPMADRPHTASPITLEPTHEPTHIVEVVAEPIKSKSDFTIEKTTLSVPEKTEPSNMEEPMSLFSAPSAIETATPVKEELEPTSSFLTVDTNASSERSSLSSSDAAASPSTVSPHEQPMRRKSTLNLFGEEIGNDDDDDDDEDEPVKPVVSTVASDSTATKTPSPKSESSFHEAESLFGEPIPVTVKPAAELATDPAPAVLKPPPARTGMLFGFASAGGDSDSDSDSEFSD